MAKSYTHANSRGVIYFLNTKLVTLKGGREQQIFYFTKEERSDTGCALPEDREVKENPNNGFLTLKKKV